MNNQEKFLVKCERASFCGCEGCSHQEPHICTAECHHDVYGCDCEFINKETKEEFYKFIKDKDGK